MRDPLERGGDAERELARCGAGDPAGDLVAVGGEPGDMRRERRDDAHAIRRRLQGDVRLGEVRPAIADHLGEAGLRTPAVERAHHRVERLASDPVPAAGVAHDVAPAVDAGDGVPADGQRDDAGARGDDGAAGVAERAEERCRRVVREHRLTDAGVTQELEQRAGIGIPVRQAGDPRREDLGREPRTGDGGADDVGELRQQRPVGMDAVEDEVVGVRAARHPDLHPGLARIDREDARRRSWSGPCVRHLISFVSPYVRRVRRGRRPAPAIDTRRRPRGR